MWWTAAAGGWLGFASFAANLFTQVFLVFCVCLLASALTRIATKLGEAASLKPGGRFIGIAGPQTELSYNPEYDSEDRGKWKISCSTSRDRMFNF